MDKQAINALKKVLTFATAQRFGIAEFEKAFTFTPEQTIKPVQEVVLAPEPHKIDCKLDFATEDCFVSGSDLSASSGILDENSSDSFNLA